MKPGSAALANRRRSHQDERRLSAAADDRLLIERIAQRDREALQCLYFAYHRRMSRFLMRLMHRYDLAEEVINDTMFLVWQQAARFRGDSQVSTWILGIAYRRALKALRYAQPPGGVFLCEAPEAGHDAGASQRELRQCIDIALTSLPAEQRLVVELCYFMGYSCAEIARIADCPVNTVKTRMYHARSRLRGMLPALAFDVEALHDWSQQHERDA